MRLKTQDSRLTTFCVPRIIIAGTKSGCGKTTITAGLIKALSKKRLKVAAFKSGPDYIDTTYHTIASNSPCRNLDGWLMPKNNLLKLFASACYQKDIAIIEGAMGLFDGQATTTKGSAAHLAKILSTPVLLIIDAAQMSMSTQAIAYGFKNIDPELNICAAILNNVGSERHFKILKQALKNAGLPLLGYLNKNKDLNFKKRHLGLLMADEKNDISQTIEHIASLIEQNFDLRQIVRIAKKAPVLKTARLGNAPYINESNCRAGSPSTPLVRIGVAKDAAFNFYYQDNLDLLEEAGAEIVYFSPLRDSKLPAVNGLYFGGGYPELYAQKLAANKRLKKEIKEAVEAKMPVYAECGGFLYLAKKLRTENGDYSMVGCLNTQPKMQPRFVALGYTQAQALSPNLILSNNKKIKGHRFHYSKTAYPQKNRYAFLLDNGEKIGCTYKNTLASYLHIHFGSDFSLAKNFVASCKEYS